MIAGFEKPTAGTITVDGKDITYKAPNQRNVGMVFQSYALFPNMTVADNIGFGLKVRKRPKADIDKRVDELLELIHLEGRGDRYPWQLSGGQQQRVALARALAIEPQVLLLDEPLSALDAKIRIVLRKEIRAIQRQLGITTVYVTHDQEEALSLSDRVVVMSDGRIEQIGTPSEIYNFPTTAFVASFVGHAQPGRRRRRRRRAPGGCRSTARRSGPARPSRAPRPDGRVTLALRPEGIDARRGRSEGSNRLRGTVEDINFLGSIVRIRVRLGDGGGRRAADHRGARHVQRAAPDGARRRRSRSRSRSRPRRASSSARRATRPAHPERGGRRRGVTVRLDGIDLVVFDKDGTLIDFGPMWSGWAETLGRRSLEAATGRPIEAPLYAMLGYDPATRTVLPRRRARGDADGAAARADRRRPGGRGRGRRDRGAGARGRLARAGPGRAGPAADGSAGPVRAPAGRRPRAGRRDQRRPRARPTGRSRRSA